jgi:hypothetical protein
MKELSSWSATNEVMYGFADSVAGHAFESV